MDKNIDHEHEFDGKQDRNFHQKPFDDVTDSLPQIDEQSASLAEKGDTKPKSGDNTDSSSSDAKDSAADGKVTEINEDDNRDQSDSATDWDAPGNRTERRK